MANSLNFNPVQLVGQVLSPAVNAAGDGNSYPVSLGRHGEVLVGEFHGRRYISRARGNGFVASSGAAGVSAIHAPAQTTGSFVLYNPAGSGVLVELESVVFTNPTSTQTQIIAGLSLEGSLQTPTGTLTLATVTNSPMGAPRGAPAAQAYGSGPTLVAMTYICGLGLNITATTGMGSPAVREFDGEIVLAPGFSINICSTLVQTSEHLGVDLFWSEWPM